MHEPTELRPLSLDGLLFVRSTQNGRPNDAGKLTTQDRHSIAEHTRFANDLARRMLETVNDGNALQICTQITEKSRAVLYSEEAEVTVREYAAILGLLQELVDEYCIT